MCEFCHQHGEGKKWYLNANNYAEDLMSDLRRRQFITRFFENPGHLAKGEQGAHGARRHARFPVEGRAPEDHGQTEAQALRPGRAHRGHRAHPGPDDLGRAAGLHLPARRGREGTALLLRRQHGAGRRRDGQAPGRDRRLLPCRAARRPGSNRCPRPTRWPGSGRASARATATRSGRSSRRSWRDLQLLAPVVLRHEDDGGPQVAGLFPGRVRGPR